MIEPRASRPYWPDALQNPPDATSGLKPWSWALERLEKSHNYWISTARPDGRPHLMVVWGIWWEDAFWFSTGPHTRKAKNIESKPYCIIATEKADEAVILEGVVQEIKDRVGLEADGRNLRSKIRRRSTSATGVLRGLHLSRRTATSLRPGRARRELRRIRHALAFPGSARLGGRRSKSHVSPCGLLATTDAFQIGIDRANRLVASDKSHIPVGPDQK